jgi:radical SAM superfamily enzyme YgiQ (UPF0313 family)
MRWRDLLAKNVVAIGLSLFTAFPFLRYVLVWLRPFVTKLIYSRRSWDYLKELRSGKYKKSDIALIQAPGWGINTPPLAIACLSAYLRANGIRVIPIDVNVQMYAMNKDIYPNGWKNDVDSFWGKHSTVKKFIEDNEEELTSFVDIVIESGAKVVGFTIYDSSYLMSLYLARSLKARDEEIVIVFGGAGASKAVTGRDIIAENKGLVDFVVEGEGEATLLDIVERTKAGKTIIDMPGARMVSKDKIIEPLPRSFIGSVDSLPIPDFTDFNFFEYYEPFKCPIESSRGCVNRCIFCNERSFWVKYRFRSGESMYKEMRRHLEMYPHITYFEFHDSLVNGNIKELGILCDFIIKDRLKIFWGGQAIVRQEMNYEFFSKLKRAGCVSLAFGMESSSKSVLEKVGKVFSKKADIGAMLRDAYRAGVGCGLNFMFGLPGETDEEAEENIEFLRRNAKYIYTVNPSPAFCLIYPGTAAYENPEKYGLDLSKGSSYWDSLDGDNTYLKRLERFESFISEVHRLKIPCVYPYSRLPNHDEAIGDYYISISDYESAAPYLESSLESEGYVDEKADKLRVCREKIASGAIQ